MNVYLIAAQQLEFRVKLSACTSAVWKLESYQLKKVVTGSKRDEVMILSPTSAICYYNLMLSQLYRCPCQILKYPGNNACGHRPPRHWMSRLRDCPLSGTERFPSPRHSLPAEVTSSNSLQAFKTKVKSHLFLASFPYFPNI